ncbi:MAG: ferritin family protein [Anaerolineae bacterium]
MVQGNTFADLFALAISAETSAAELYRGLAAKFAQYSDVAEFWQRYVTDEIAHARWLARLQGDLSVEQLGTRVDPMILENARHAAGLVVETILDQVHTLADAYELVNELEHSEVNAVFEFLISSFPADPEVLAFLRTQLSEHINRLVTAFPERFRDPGARLAVVAQA